MKMNTTARDTPRRSGSSQALETSLQVLESVVGVKALEVRSTSILFIPVINFRSLTELLLAGGESVRRALPSHSDFTIDSRSLRFGAQTKRFGSTWLPEPSDGIQHMRNIGFWEKRL